MSQGNRKVYECGLCQRTLRDDISETSWHWDNFYATVHNKLLPRADAIQGIRCMNCWNYDIQMGNRPLGFLGKVAQISWEVRHPLGKPTPSTSTGGKGPAASWLKGP